MLQFETKQNLTRLEGSTGISSSQLFSGESSSRDNYTAGPDLAELKDGMRDGVNRVAGKLSQLASGLMNSIQVSWKGGIAIKTASKLGFLWR